MKRKSAISALAAVAVALAAVLHADVKTTEKTQIKFEGMMGRMFSMFGGSAAKEGVTATVALKGARLSRISDTTGQIIDLNEQKVYDLDVKKKEYTVITFDEMRRRIQEAREKAQKDLDKARKDAKDVSAEDKQAMEDAGKQLEFDFDVKETGQHKTIAGLNTREVIMTITGHEKGKKIDDSGGFVMTSDMWLAPKVAALDEIGAFELKYFKAVYGESLAMDMKQMAQMSAMYPAFSKMAERMQTEGRKMEGTAVLTTTTFEGVKSAEAMKTAANPPSGGGGGIGGMLARRIARGGPAQQKTTIMTTTNERLSIQTSASAEDVAIPAGFKEKK